MAEDIWTIIGLSSLVASVVTVILGIAKDVLVERYRFKRQSEAGYLQSQIQMFSRLHFLLERIRRGAIGTLFRNIGETAKEINMLIEANVNLLPSEILNEWLDAMALLEESLKEQNAKKPEEQVAQASEKFEKILVLLEEVANKDLIPKYRKIVGKTVTLLHGYSFEDKSLQSLEQI